jgi:regulator of sigma E protease
MSILIFIILLAILVFVHELGHFLVAKRSGIRVDEFAIGFPPALYKKKKGETTYALNLIPFGGYVRIFGENPDEDSLSGPDASRSFAKKPKLIQIAVLIAGIAANVVFAWLLFSGSFMIGMPTSASVAGADRLHDPALTVTAVSPGSPAADAGLKPGDRIVYASSADQPYALNREMSMEEFQHFIAAHQGQEVTVAYRREGDTLSTATVVPESGIISDKAAIGVGLDVLGIMRLPLHKALVSGAAFTADMTAGIANGLKTMIADAFRGEGDISQVTGPIGIVGLVGDATDLGFAYLLSFAAFISLNLAMINLIPFPALDGGRILFVIIEALKGSPIKPKVANAFNLAGFALLMILMVVVTWHDIARLLGM